MSIKTLFNQFKITIQNLFNEPSHKSMNPNYGKNFDFISDDPSVPLKENLSIPQLPDVCPVFTMVGSPDDAQNIQVYSNIIFSINFVQKALMQPLNRWSSTNNLQVYARAGNDFNAYYDRANLKFFFNKSQDGQMVFTCESPDIVSHELGHAILDAVRPDLWNVQCLETAAFHEAFGDTMAILSALQHENVVRFALSETKNDLRNSNVISRLAEQMGVAINQMTNGRAGMADALRNAVNGFRYTEPEKLPYSAGNDAQLAGECHSFSRVFSGAWYDCLTGMYGFELSRGLEPYDAIVKARDAMATIYLRCLPMAPLNPRFYAAIGNAMQVSARNYFPEYEQIIKNAFVLRNIIRRNVSALSDKKFSDIKINNNDHVWKLKNTSIVRKLGTSTFKIPSSHGIVALSCGLDGVEIEVPNEDYMEFNHNNMVQELSISDTEAQEHAMFAVKKLVDNNQIEFLDSIDHSKNHTKTHVVFNGKLQRLYHN